MVSDELGVVELHAITGCAFESGWFFSKVRILGVRPFWHVPVYHMPIVTHGQLCMHVACTQLIYSTPNAHHRYEVCMFLWYHPYLCYFAHIVPQWNEFKTRHFQEIIDLQTMHFLLDYVLPPASHASISSHSIAPLQSGALWYTTCSTSGC